MQAEPGKFEPDHSDGSDSAGEDAVPVLGRNWPMIEVSGEEVEINDPENAKSFCDIEPEKPFHQVRLPSVTSRRKQEVTWQASGQKVES